MSSNFKEKIAICYACSGESYRESVIKRLTRDYYSDENLYYYIITDNKEYFKDVKLDNLQVFELKDFYEEFPEIPPYEFLIEAKDKNEYAEKFVSMGSYRYPMSILRFLFLQAYKDGITNIALLNTDTKFLIDKIHDSIFDTKNRVYNAVSQWDDYIWNNSMHFIAKRLHKKHNLIPDQIIRILDACARFFIFDNLENTKKFFDVWHDIIMYVYQNDLMKNFEGWYAKNEEYIIGPIYNVFGLSKEKSQAESGLFNVWNNPNKERFWLTPDENMIRHTNYQEFLKINNLEDGDIPTVKKEEKKKILVVQYYTDNLKYAKYSIELNKSYCDRHEYDYYVYNDSENLLKHSHQNNEAIQWFKVVLLKKMLEEKPDYDWYFFLDMDAIFSNHKMKIEEFIDEKYELVFADDYSHHCLVNTGVFLVKNSNWNKEFLQRWYDSRLNITGKEALDIVDWSGGMNHPDNPTVFKSDAFHEQTCISVLYKKDPELKDKIKIIDKEIFNNHSYRRDAFIFHAFGYHIDEYKSLNLLHEALTTPFDKFKKIKVVYFVLCKGKYLDIVKSDLSRIIKSGLYDELDELHIVGSIYPGDSDEVFDKLCDVFKGYKKVHLMKCYGNRFEHYGITKAWVESHKSDGYIMYFHAKGVINVPTNSNPHSEWKQKGDDSFKEMLKYYTIDNYKECLKKLEVYDMITVSDSYSRGWPSGNFWWSNMSYLRENVYPYESIYDRFFSEAWINITRRDYSCYQFYERFSYRDKFTYLPEKSYKDPKSLSDKKIILKSAKLLTLLEPENEQDHNIPKETHEVDFTEYIQQNLDSNQGKGFSNILVGVNTMGRIMEDPAPGYKKSLVIEFQIQEDNEIYRLVGDEGAILNYKIDKPVSLGYIFQNNEKKDIIY